MVFDCLVETGYVLDRRGRVRKAVRAVKPRIDRRFRHCPIGRPRLNVVPGSADNSMDHRWMTPPFQARGSKESGVVLLVWRGDVPGSRKPTQVPGASIPVAGGAGGGALVPTARPRPARVSALP